MTPADLATALDALPPADPPGLSIILDMTYSPRFDTALPHRLAGLVERQGEIEQAIRELDAYTGQVREVIRRCLDCPAIPASSPPPGF